MTASQIRQSFLDFFAERSHRIVSSASLLPTAPNLLFTNAGMNPFVPYFLGEREPEDPRVADTQKCIRAGGKHNDLEDVGFDGYHHTFFEMLGNWSFGDYFKKEAIHWAWELLTHRWAFPKDRLYVTVYRPAAGDPGEEDTEAATIWSELLRSEGLDPDRHLCFSGKKDNFWMMGETGPCGPCSELHVDLTPDKQGPGLVNADSPWCIEVWNLVFIQFNAREDGTLEPLKDRHVDTGMGLERICGILSSTEAFSRFDRPPSNYESDLFTPLFRAIEELTPHRYSGTLPGSRDGAGLKEMERVDCAFRVIADHLRTLSCAIADGILPGNEGRNYVLRRILRRAVLYGRGLNLPEGFLSALAPAVRTILGQSFPELKTKAGLIDGVLLAEEQAFARTLDRGLQTLEKRAEENGGVLNGTDVFLLYDTYGFPVDLTQLVAREKGITLSLEGFDTAMESQRERARAARKQTVIEVSRGETGESTRFLGYEENLETVTTRILEVVDLPGEGQAVIVAETQFYAEMGGQTGDSGILEWTEGSLPIRQTAKDGAGRILHVLGTPAPVSLTPGSTVTLRLDLARRRMIELHHTATHLLNWALRKTLGDHVQQAGSYVGPDRLRFDFTHFQSLTPEELKGVRKLVEGAIADDLAVGAYEIAFRDKPEGVIATFGEKYGNRVRVVDIGGLSKELCGGTHTRRTGKLRLFVLLQETAIAAGVRRIEAVVGDAALNLLEERQESLQAAAGSLSCRPEEVESRIQGLMQERRNLERQIRAFRQKVLEEEGQRLMQRAEEEPGDLLLKAVVAADDPGELRSLAMRLTRQFPSRAVLLVAAQEEKLSMVAATGEAARQAGWKAGAILRAFAQSVGARGGGKDDLAMGGGPLPGDLGRALEAFAFKPTAD